jgi:polysaccharide pyruvyl transferase WcaK-like protein
MVIGNYGNRNIGDEAILSCLLDIVEETAKSIDTDSDIGFYVPVRSAGNLKAFHDRANLRPVPVKKPWQLFFHLLRCRAVIIGGGGIFSGYTGPLAKLIPLFGLGAKLLGKKVAYVGVGCYGTASTLEKQLVRLSMLFSDVVCVRDESSANTLRGLARFKHVQLGCDLAFFLAGDGSRPSLVNGHIPVEARNDELKIGLSLKPVKDHMASGLLVEAFSRIINKLDQELDHRVRFIFFPFAMTDSRIENDWALGTELKTRIDNGGCLVLLDQAKPREFLDLIGQMDIVLGMRFHSQVFAHLAAVPLIGIKYEEKNRDFLDALGVPAFTVDDVVFQPEKVGRAIIDEIPRMSVSQRLGSPSASLLAG